MEFETHYALMANTLAGQLKTWPFATVQKHQLQKKQKNKKKTRQISVSMDDSTEK